MTERPKGDYEYTVSVFYLINAHSLTESWNHLIYVRKTSPNN